MTDVSTLNNSLLENAKFKNRDVTKTGEIRASVQLKGLKTLWFNTGTLCNLTCNNCYIESSPKNDRLVYLTTQEVVAFLDELVSSKPIAVEVAFTGGEPFMNPEFLEMITECAERGHRVLILTNAMRPMMKCEPTLLSLKARFEHLITIRVSLDHYTASLHDLYRGDRAFETALMGLKWLSDNGFRVHIAGRTIWNETEKMLRSGFERLCNREKIAIDAFDATQLLLFPEMDETLDVPEITEACWSILGVNPDDMMCATSRMIVKRKGALKPTVLPCTLLPYETELELGSTLENAEKTVKLNHPHCSRFCVLGGGSCCVPQN
tara:strand:- start:38338 stop:39303 length:966 start_codon:yes stop_codon:yes gene_type:complete